MWSGTIPSGEALIEGVAFIEDRTGSRVNGRFYLCHPNVDLPEFPVQEDQDFILDLSEVSQVESPKQSPLKGGVAELEAVLQARHEEMMEIASRGPFTSAKTFADTLGNMGTKTSREALDEFLTLTERLFALLRRYQRVTEAVSSGTSIAKIQGLFKALAREQGDPAEDLVASLRKAVGVSVKIIKKLNKISGEGDPMPYEEADRIVEEIPKRLEEAIAVLNKLLIPDNFVANLAARYLRADFPLGTRKYLEPTKSYRAILPFLGGTCESTHKFFGVIEPYVKSYVEGINVVPGAAVGISPYGGTTVITKKQWYDFYDQARAADQIHRGGAYVINAMGRTFRIKNSHPEILKPSIPQSPKTQRTQFKPGGVLNYVCGVLDYVVSRYRQPKKPSLGFRFVCPWYTSHPNLLEVLSNVFGKDLFFCAHVMYERAASAPTLRENIFYYTNAAGIPGLSTLYRSRRLVGLPPPKHSLYTKTAEGYFYNHPKSPPGKVLLNDAQVGIDTLFGLLEALVVHVPPSPDTTVRAIANYIAFCDQKTENWAPKKKPAPRKGKN